MRIWLRTEVHYTDIRLCGCLSSSPTSTNKYGSEKFRLEEGPSPIKIVFLKAALKPAEKLPQIQTAPLALFSTTFKTDFCFYAQT